MKGLHAEYDRVANQPKDKQTEADSKSATLQASLAASKTEIESLQVSIVSYKISAALYDRSSAGPRNAEYPWKLAQHVPYYSIASFCVVFLRFEEIVVQR